MEHQDSGNSRKNSGTLWAQPWMYRESFIIVLLILALSVLLGILTEGRDIPAFTAPYHIFIGAGFVLLLVFFSIFYRNKPFIQWLSGQPAALSAIILYALVLLVMVLLPQDRTYKQAIVMLSGLSHIKTSWLFLLTNLFFLTTLGMVAIRRCFPFSARNFGFFLSHFGLFLALLAATLGSGNIQRLEINLLKEGNESNIGVSKDGEMVKLPFALRLLDFTIEEYNPRLALMDMHSGHYITFNGRDFPMVEKGLKTTLGNWRIEITDYMPQAIFKDSTFVISNKPGSYMAVYVKAISGRDTMKGWVSNGSYLQNSLYLPLDSTQRLVLTKPEPRKYSALVEVMKDSLKTDTATIEVNKPYTVKGWKIYQVGYDQSKGKWSNLSVLEAIKDPSLPLVYTGFFMVMAGVVSLLLIGKFRL